MKASISVLLALWCTSALAQSFATEPTLFEAYVLTPSATIRSSQNVGKIRSSDAILNVVAIVAEDTALPAGEMRGARFDLQNNMGLGHVYLDEGQLAAIKHELTWIEKGIPRLENGPRSQWRVQGTGACWMPRHPLRILCPSYRVGPDWSGFTLSAYGGPVLDDRESHRPRPRPA